MKKLLFTFIALFSFGVTANYAVDSKELVIQTTQDTFKKIEIKDLPTAITDLVKNEYESNTIDEAFIKEEQGKKVYKLVLKGKDGNITILCNEEGKLIEDKQASLVTEEAEESEVIEEE